MVRKALKTTVLATALILLQGCVLLYDIEPKVFQVQGVTVSSALETSITLKVECDVYWTATIEGESWAHIDSPADKYVRGDGELVISFDINNAPDTRNAVVLVKSGSNTKRLSISQGGLNSFFQPSELLLTGTNASYLNFNPPEAWSVAVTEGADWLSLSGSTSGMAGKVTLSVFAKDANENVGSRSGSLSITIGKGVYTIPVVQSQKDVLLVSDTEINLEDSACEFTVHTSTNVDYEIEVSDSWIHHVPPTKALNEYTELFTVEDNPYADIRTATVFFRSKDLPELKLTVIQAKKDLALLQTVAGLYAIQEQSYSLGQDGWNLSSRVIKDDGSFEYRLFNASSLQVVRATGIDPNAPVGSTYKMHVVVHEKGNVIVVRDYDATVAAYDDDFIRLRTDSKTYFVIQRPL